MNTTTEVFASWSQPACFFLLLDWPTWLGSRHMQKTQGGKILHSWQTYCVFCIVRIQHGNPPLFSCLHWFVCDLCNYLILRVLWIKHKSVIVAPCWCGITFFFLTKVGKTPMYVWTWPKKLRTGRNLRDSTFNMMSSVSILQNWSGLPLKWLLTYPVDKSCGLALSGCLSGRYAVGLWWTCLQSCWWSVCMYVHANV